MKGNTILLKKENTTNRLRSKPKAQSLANLFTALTRLSTKICVAKTNKIFGHCCGREVKLGFTNSGST